MTTMLYDLCLKDGHAMINDNLEHTDIYVKDGKISLITDKYHESKDTIDCKNLTVLPGVIDSQVHFREPGLEGKETLESGNAICDSTWRHCNI